MPADFVGSFEEYHAQTLKAYADFFDFGASQFVAPVWAPHQHTGGASTTIHGMTSCQPSSARWQRREDGWP